jgi:hypothetical protein
MDGHAYHPGTWSHYWSERSKRRLLEGISRPLICCGRLSITGSSRLSRPGRTSSLIHSWERRATVGEQVDMQDYAGGKPMNAPNHTGSTSSNHSFCVSERIIEAGPSFRTVDTGSGDESAPCRSALDAGPAPGHTLPTGYGSYCSTALGPFAA